MRLSPLLLCVLFSISAAVPSVVPAGSASAAENQSSPPTDGQGGGGHDCEHEKKDETVS